MTYAKRKSTRMPSWDYATAATYFVTACTHGRKPLFGKIEYDKEGSANQAFLMPTAIGAICLEEIDRLAQTDRHGKIIASVVMPNHVHILLEVQDAERSEQPTESLTSIVARLKRGVTHRARKESPEVKIWQRGFHDHIVRSDADFARIYEYIENNPIRWAIDKYHVE